jgi:hypothetical protein
MKNIERYKKDIDRLINEGKLLYFFLICEIKKDKEFKKEIEEKIKKPIPKFSDEYQIWYSEALECLRQLLPSRVEDFISYYKPSPKRKEITVENYTISDYLCGIGTKVENWLGLELNFDLVIFKFNQQLKIIESLRKKFESSLFNIKTILQSDLFNNELDAAEELNNKGFLRAAGVLAGVVLESYLKQVCDEHGIKINKQKPTISDFNDALKNAGIIDIPKWRHIQWLADIRHLCAHKKDREPTKSEVEELISNIRKLTKNLF